MQVAVENNLFTYWQNNKHAVNMAQNTNHWSLAIYTYFSKEVKSYRLTSTPSSWFTLILGDFLVNQNMYF